MQQFRAANKRLHMKTLKTFYILGALLLATTMRGQADMSKVDGNFKVENVEGIGVLYYNALETPFSVEGFAWRKDGEKLYRIPKQTASNPNLKNVAGLANHTAGGAVRFQTDSRNIALRYKLKDTTDMPHMTRSGACGFDVFISPPGDQDSYLKTVHPPRRAISEYSKEQVKIAQFQQRRMRQFTIWLPLYGGVESLEVGIEKGAKILAPMPHKIKKPVLFYGSSITQGGCAYRPANAYTTMLCRELDAEQINLGFSGNAKGEIEIARDIASLNLAAFVFDYDYNAPTPEHLEKTHEPFFLEIRKKHPNLPIIILSRCSNMTDRRRDIVKQTYLNAVARGDKNVSFIDGAELFGTTDKKYPTVDGCHPNDLGFYLMFQRILPTLKETLINDSQNASKN